MPSGIAWVTSRAMPEPDLLNIREVAGLLRVGEKTTYTLAQNGELPGFKVGGQWRFKRSDIEDWIEAKKRAASGHDTSFEEDR